MCPADEPASPRGNHTSQLYAAVLGGFEARIAGLVEMFLVEVYRCTLCRFMSNIKSKIRTHLARMHETDTACQISGCPKMDQDESESYSMADYTNQEDKENEENLAKNVCLTACVLDASERVPTVVTQAQAVRAVILMPLTPNTLFGEAAAHLQLEEPCSAVLISLSYSKSKDEEAA